MKGKSPIHVLFSCIGIQVYNASAFSSFQLPKLFEPIFQGKSLNVLSQKKQEISLLEAVSSTQNGKNATPLQQRNVLAIVSSLEMSCPAPALADILENDATRSKLDGTWYLQYTSPSSIEDLDDVEGINGDSSEWKVENAEENITTKRYNAKGSVSAGGIEVDVSKDPPKQIFDLSISSVFNEVKLDNGFVRVGGPFKISEKKGTRALVSFKECKINLNFGLKLDLGFLFAIRAIFAGSDENGWLETTYLSDRIRIGRGNKGSMFVLTRDKSDVTP
jgi:hypothetical protein